MVQYAETKMKKGGGSSAAENVKVIVRCRPMNQKETSDGNTRYGSPFCNNFLLLYHLEIELILVNLVKQHYYLWLLSVETTVLEKNCFIGYLFFVVLFEKIEAQ